MILRKCGWLEQEQPNVVKELREERERVVSEIQEFEKQKGKLKSDLSYSDESLTTRFISALQGRNRSVIRATIQKIEQSIAECHKTISNLESQAREKVETFLFNHSDPLLRHLLPDVLQLAIDALNTLNMNEAQRGQANLLMTMISQEQKCDWKGLLASANAFIELCPPGFMSYYYKALALNGIGSDTGEKASLVAAVDAYSQAINIGEVGAEDYLAIAHCNRGCIRTDVLEDHNGAIQDFEMALKLAPDKQQARDGMERARNAISKATIKAPSENGQKREKSGDVCPRCDGSGSIAAYDETRVLDGESPHYTEPCPACNGLGRHSDSNIPVAVRVETRFFWREERKNSDHFRLTK